MSVDKLVDSTQLDTDLASVANAIRAKSGGSSQLAFPAGFVSEIGNIPSGGGGPTLLASGTYTKSNTAKNQLDIPVSFTGTPALLFVYVPSPISGVSQAISWLRQVDLPQTVTDNFPFDNTIGAYHASNGTQGRSLASMSLQNNNTALRIFRHNTSYQLEDNTYKWYIWGYAS